MSENKEIILLPKPNIEPANPSQVQIIEHGRDIHMFKITDAEIDELCSEYMSIDFGLFTLCIGICVAFIIALITAQMSDKIFATFIAVAFVSLLGVIFFGFRTFRVRQRVEKRAKQIKESGRI
jgi:glucan phosphoethanolaminetransferase (alkaline phosphatase superfamily)